MKNIKKRTLSVITALTSALVFAVAGCGEEPHVHTYENGWSSDETMHWHAATCEHTELKSSPNSHNFEDGVCTICDYEKKDSEEGKNPVTHEHEYATEWSSNETHHWHAAICEHSDLKTDYDKHTFKDGKCTKCKKPEETTPVDPPIDTPPTPPDEWEEGENFYGNTYTDDAGWEYKEIYDPYFKLVGYAISKGSNSAASRVEIPSAFRDLPVMEIYQYGFENFEATEIVIPNSVKTIGYQAFNASTVREVVMADSVVTLENSVFYDCTNLTKVTLSANLTFIPDYTFYNCKNLNILTFTGQVASTGDLRLSDNLKEIGKNAFDLCTKLIAFYPGEALDTVRDFAFWSANIQYYDIKNLNNWAKIDFSTNAHSPIYRSLLNTNRPVQIYSNGKLVKDLVISGVDKIGGYCFAGADLNSVTIGDGVTTLGEGVFLRSTLRSVVIGDSVTSVVQTYSDVYASEGTFKQCEFLTSVKLGTGLKELGEGMFAYCTALTEIDLSYVEVVSVNAFGGCSALRTVTLGNALKKLSNDCFRDCPVRTFNYKGTIEEWRKVEQGTSTRGVYVKTSDGQTHNAWND